MDTAANRSRFDADTLMSAVHPRTGLHDRIEKSLKEVDLVDAVSADASDIYESPSMATLYRGAFFLSGGCVLAFLLHKAVKGYTATNSSD